MGRTMPHEWLDATWIDRGDGETIIQYADANKSIRYVDAPFLPYFFVEDGTLKPSDELFIKQMRGHVSKQDKNGSFLSPRRKALLKIELPMPSSVRTVRDRLERQHTTTYESEVPYIRRVTWDEGINQCLLKDRCAFDVEVDARKGFPDIKDPFQRILSIAVVGSDGKEYFFADKDEKETFKQFYGLMRKKYHLMTGWNIRDFDLPYLQARAKRIGFKIPFVPCQEIDAMLNYQKASAWGFMGLSYKLDDVADRELGMTKISFRTKGKIEDLWNSFDGDQKVLKEYNLTDARLVRKLDEKLRLSELYVTLSRLVKLLLRDAVWVSACAEVLLMRELIGMNPRICFPRRAWSEPGTLPGGYVKDPLFGLHFFVYHYDFTSLYNRIIQTYSLSPEIYPWFEEEYFTEHGKQPEGLCLNEYTAFLQKKKAEGVLWDPILPTILNRLEAWRKDYQKQRDTIQDHESMDYIYYQIGQTALKLIILGCWGIMGRKNARFYNVGLATNITLGGQDIAAETEKIVEQMGYRLLYYDTDGFFFEVIKEEDKDLFAMTLKAQSIADEINARLKERIMQKYSLDPKDFHLSVGARYVMPRCFFVSKKRYLGSLIWEEGKYGHTEKVAGVEMRRSDAFDLLKESQRAIMAIFLHASEKEIEQKCADYMTDIRQGLYHGKYDDKLLITTGSKKKIEQYTGNSPQRRLIRQLEDAGAYRPGDDICWFITGKDQKGNLDAKAIIPGTPMKAHIRKDGYDIYWDRLRKLPEKLMGRNLIPRGDKLVLGEPAFNGEVPKLESFFT